MKEPKCIQLTQRSYSEKVIYFMIPKTWHYGKCKITGTKKRSIVGNGLFGESEMYSWSTKDLSGQYSGFVWYCNYAVVKTHRTI